ncbi:PEP-CTERM sorting domain-containing protein [Amantichitinum ursilacus]|uniref:PEP-CTERM motif protein n=1 Tax=Amantichitinum ursilacus TaxID=857265 RepID=A0A0N0GR37_9NEIS|nr:PEP-CTERM sorting domain-containing protein [Amantichitinum ursilacus]KPC55311.1 PEP-CTERM motif protein [Amantichitinum ursilacus]
MHKTVLALSLLAALSAPLAHATVLQNGTLQVGIDDGGAIIDQTALIGLAYDPSGKGNYANDLLWPGVAFGFTSVGVGGSYDTAGGEFYQGANPFGYSLVSTSATSLTQAGAYNGLGLLQTVSLSGSTVHFTVTLTNTTAASIDGVTYAVGADPDLNYYSGGEFETTNSKNSSGSGSAFGALSGITLTLADVSTGSIKGLISSQYPWSVDPYALSGASDFTAGTDDLDLALGFNLGSLGAGQSVTLAYDYTLAAVPEPETYAMMGLGLVALMAARKKRAGRSELTVA